jgi:tryptophan synthase alpha chain
LSGIDDAFKRLKGSKEGAYIPYICTGDPTSGFSLKLMKALSEAGADIFEVGIPFSDPIADGALIQGAMQRSLTGGFKTPDVFKLISSAREAGIKQPIVVMTYYNSVMHAGVGEFCLKLKKAGGDGILIVDLLPEDSTELDAAASKNGLDLIRLIAVNSSDKRVGMILSKATGFAYVVSVAGTTGVRDALPWSAFGMISKIMDKSKVPLALGFGISKPEDVRSAMAAGASAVVEGSKLISIYAEKLGDEEEALAEVKKHATKMKAATKHQTA